MHNTTELTNIHVIGLPEQRKEGKKQANKTTKNVFKDITTIYYVSLKNYPGGSTNCKLEKQKERLHRNMTVKCWKIFLSKGKNLKAAQWSSNKHNVRLTKTEKDSLEVHPTNTKY